jgi:hypothetical protein
MLPRLFPSGDPAADGTRLLTPMSLMHSVGQPPVHSYTAIPPSLLPRNTVSHTMQASDGSCDEVLGGGWTVYRLVLLVAVDAPGARRAFVSCRNLQDLKVPGSMDSKRYGDQ